jgi:hypothetical protein
MTEPLSEIPWEGLCAGAASAFAIRCAELNKANPYGSATKPLKYILVFLMTELWDRGFSQTEIREAYQAAVAQLPGYAVDEKRF